SGSLRFTHQLKFNIRPWNERSRKRRSARPNSVSIRYRNSVAQACTGGFTSLKFHSYAGICPLGWEYRLRNISNNCSLAKSKSTSDSAMVWNARSHAAYHGYSHLSGMEITSLLSMWNHSGLRAVRFLPLLISG